MKAVQLIEKIKKSIFFSDPIFFKANIITNLQELDYIYRTLRSLDKVEKDIILAYLRKTVPIFIMEKNQAKNRVPPHPVLTDKYVQILEIAGEQPDKVDAIIKYFLILNTNFYSGYIDPRFNVRAIDINEVFKKLVEMYSARVGVRFFDMLNVYAKGKIAALNDISKPITNEYEKELIQEMEKYDPYMLVSDLDPLYYTTC